MNWRPKRWDIMDYLTVGEQMESPLFAMKCFEAGADAMLEALKEEIEKVENPDKEWLKNYPQHDHEGLQGLIQGFEKCRQAIKEILK